MCAQAKERPVLALTMGDVNGVGPEILVRALARSEVWQWCIPVVVGSDEVLRSAASRVAGCPAGVLVEDLRSLPLASGEVAVIDGGFKAPRVRAGVLDPEAGLCAAEWTKTAVRLAMRGAVAGLVTCPLNKEAMRKAGYPFAGHTPLIADMTSSPDYRMCLFGDTMRIVHITAHLSLREAIEAVTKERIVRSVEIGHEALLRLGMDRPRIAVAGLNPHAGEAGDFGREEIEEIRPAVEECRAHGLPCDGPYPPDTVFRRMYLGEFDLVVALYHDQGHIPMKLVAMDEGVNVTLGIPLVRTSVDHGTAFDIAWQGKAREDSLCAAIRLAARFAGAGVAAEGRNA